MKVLDLHCAQQHVFEGWFSSEEDFLAQISEAAISCPMCGDRLVSKLPSAPRLNLGGVAQVKPGASIVDAAQLEVMKAMQNVWLETAKRILASTEDVGSRFTEVARKIHYGDIPERAIRGSATRAETESLMDEGIAVLPLILPDSLKGPVQ